MMRNLAAPTARPLARESHPPHPLRNPFPPSDGTSDSTAVNTGTTDETETAQNAPAASDMASGTSSETAMDAARRTYDARTPEVITPAADAMRAHRPSRSLRQDVALLTASGLALLLLAALCSATLHYYDGHPAVVLLGSFTAFFTAFGAAGALVAVVELIKENK